MMAITIFLENEDATRALGARLGAALRPGDAVFLQGDLGAGKSALARAAVHAALGREEHVPSPTFTLVQRYETPRGPVLHADLYRLSDPEEAVELGLEEAFADGAALIEWPDRLGPLTPEDRLEVMLAIAPGGAGRSVALSATGPRGERLAEAMTRERDGIRADFLTAAGWGAAAAAPLAGDASDRRYLRLSREGEPAVLMDSPLEKGEDVRPFVAVTRMMRGRGLSAPDIIAEDPAHGFLLLEDLGDALYARLCADDPACERPLYEAAVDLLAGLRATPDDALPPYDDAVLGREAALLTEWWAPAAGAALSAEEQAEYRALMGEATAAAEPVRGAVVLRDYHAENLIWLPDRAGAARVGLLDYQDALLGHPAYDLVSLLEDARRDVPRDLAEAMIARYLAARPDLEPESFRAAYAALGAQRNAKIVGIFARLWLRDGKPGYLDLIPRVWAHLMQDLAAPGLARLRGFIAAHIPEPDAETLARVRAGRAV